MPNYKYLWINRKRFAWRSDGERLAVNDSFAGILVISANGLQPSMTALNSTARPRILVAIDIAKVKHEVLVELPAGKRRKMIVRNQLNDFRQLAGYLKRLEGTLEIAFRTNC